MTVICLVHGKVKCWIGLVLDGEVCGYAFRTDSF
jgi:hypothetical protein